MGYFYGNITDATKYGINKINLPDSGEYVQLKEFPEVVFKGKGNTKVLSPDNGSSNIIEFTTLGDTVFKIDSSVMTSPSGGALSNFLVQSIGLSGDTLDAGKETID